MLWSVELKILLATSFEAASNLKGFEFSFAASDLEPGEIFFAAAAAIGFFFLGIFLLLIVVRGTKGACVVCVAVI